MVTESDILKLAPDFRQAAREYQFRIDRCYTAAEELRDAQSLERQAKQAVDVAEAQVRMDPVHEWGANAEIRAAQMVVFLDADDEYGAALLELEQWRTTVARWTDEVRKCRDEMNLYQRQMDWAIAQARFLAKGGLNDFGN